MARTMVIGEADSDFREVLSAVSATGQPVIVEQGGRPVAVVITVEQWQARERARERAWATVELVRQRNAHLDPDAVLADVTAEVEAVRQEMDDEQQQPGRGGG